MGKEKDTSRARDKDLHCIIQSRRKKQLIGKIITDTEKEIEIKKEKSKATKACVNMNKKTNIL